MLDRDLVRLAQEPGYRRWVEQVRGTGGCARPVYLAGSSTAVDVVSGVVVRHFDTAAEPGGRLAVRCRNRRASVCPACSREHSGDTFHLVRAGLVGGKGVPGSVGGHPRLFVTLTAPSFGAVHRAGSDGCRPRSGGGSCVHGRPVGCGLVHDEGDVVVGQPVCAECYDYAGHVLWHAHVGELWSRFCRMVRRYLAREARARSSVGPGLSFAKVAEYQRRGAVHFHAVVRLDGPDGPDAPPPPWATAELLDDAVRMAAASARVTLPPSDVLGERVFRWGGQLDVRPIRSDLGDGSPVSDEAVAAYVAKYVSKSVGDAGGFDRRIRSVAEIAFAPGSPHLRALMGMCWRLGGLPELGDLRLRAWAHTLGFRGHCLTKSRRYSTTYRVLRQARADHRQPVGSPPADPSRVVVVSSWRYVGSGHTRGEAAIAAGIAEDLAELRVWVLPRPVGRSPDG
ncbi:plasmid replication initiator protein [Streptomyces sp. NBC_00448]